MPPEPSRQGPVFYYSGCAHTKHLLQQRNNRLTRRPVFKGSPQLTTKPHITLGVCQNTYPTTSSTCSGKFCISPALACMLGYKLLIMKCELLFRSFTIQPCASLLLACILSPLPEVVGGKLVHSLSVFSQMFQAG